MYVILLALIAGLLIYSSKMNPWSYAKSVGPRGSWSADIDTSGCARNLPRQIETVKDRKNTGDYTIELFDNEWAELRKAALLPWQVASLFKTNNTDVLPFITRPVDRSKIHELWGEPSSSTNYETYTVDARIDGATKGAPQCVHIYQIDFVYAPNGLVQAVRVRGENLAKPRWQSTSMQLLKKLRSAT